MLIIGATMLLSQMALTIKGSVLGMQDVSYENEAILAAGSIARSVLREAAAKSFDEQSIGKGRFTNPEQLNDILRRLSSVDGALKGHPMPEGRSAHPQQ